MNGVIVQFFEWYCTADGSLWKKISNDIEAIKKLGISALWLPPAYKGMKGADSEGYDVYDLYDLGEFDQKGSIRTKYGTREEYIEVVRLLQENNIQVYADVVLNHMGGADTHEKVTVKKADTDDHTKFISEPFEIEAATGFTFPARAKKYSEFVWNYQCFTGVGYAEDSKEEGVYNILNDYGDTWEEVVGEEKGNYDFLMLSDIEFRNPAVREEMKRWGKWYYDTIPFNGVRLDALKHISPAFYNEWIDYMKQEVNPELAIIGEYWTTDNLYAMQQYIEATEGRVQLFDCLLHYNFRNASISGNNYDLRNIFNNSLVSVQPELSVTFVENHDTQPLQSLESPVEPWFKPLAYALILLRQEGYPCVFYSDLYGCTYKDKGQDGNEYEIVMPVIKELEKLILARNKYAIGTQHDYFDHPNCIGWVRLSEQDEEDNTVCAVILSNGDKGYKEMAVGKQFAGEYFVDFLGNHIKEVLIDHTGTGKFYVNERSVSVWVPRT